MPECLSAEVFGSVKTYNSLLLSFAALITGCVTFVVGFLARLQFDSRPPFVFRFIMNADPFSFLDFRPRRRLAMDPYIFIL